MKRTIRISALVSIGLFYTLACSILTNPFSHPEKTPLQPTSSNIQPTRADVQPTGSVVEPTSSIVDPPNANIQPTNSSTEGGFGAFTMLGQLGGTAYAVAQQGNIIFLGQGPRLVALDVSKPGTTQFLSQSQVLPGSKTLVAGKVTGIQISGKYAYLAAFTGGLHVMDISQPTAIKLVNSVYPDVPGCVAVTLQGDTAYLACNPSGLFIVDIRNPEVPLILSSGKFIGATASIAVSGNYVYLSTASGQSGLLVIDVTDPANPTQVGFLAANEIPDPLTPYMFVNVRVCGNYICMAGQSAGVVVVDISEPAAPKIATLYQTNSISGDSLLVDRDRMYIVDERESVLFVLDISDPVHPKQIGSMPTTQGSFELSLSQGHERGMFVSAETLWITDRSRGLVAVDVSNPSKPQRIGHYQTPVPNWSMDIAVQGEYAYIVGIGSGFRVVGISDPQNLRELSYNDSRYPDVTGVSPSAVKVRGDYAYVSDLNFPFRVYDVSDRSNPKVASEIYDFAASDGAFDLELVGNTVYLTGWGLKDAFYPGEGLWLIDVSDPPKAAAVKFIDTPNTNSRLAAEGGYLYVMDGSQHCKQPDTLSMRIFDIRDERNPGKVSVTPLRDQNTLSYEDLVVKDQSVYIGSGQTGMDILDVSNPAQPGLLSNTPDARVSHKFAVEGETLFIGDLFAYDISNLQKPSLKGYSLAFTGAEAISVVGDTLYVVTLDNGLFIFKFKP